MPSYLFLLIIFYKISFFFFLAEMKNTIIETNKRKYHFIEVDEQDFVCVICLDPQFDKVKSCSNGHWLCFNCYDSWNRSDRSESMLCPECPILLKDFLILEVGRSLRNLSVECKYCKKKFGSFKIDDHEKNCKPMDYCPVNCKISKMSEDDLFKHLNDGHYNLLVKDPIENIPFDNKEFKYEFPYLFCCRIFALKNYGYVFINPVEHDHFVWLNILWLLKPFNASKLTYVFHINCPNFRTIFNRCEIPIMKENKSYEKRIISQDMLYSNNDMVFEIYIKSDDFVDVMF